MDKKKIIYIEIILVLTVILSITYFSYAFFTRQDIQNGKLNIVTGTLSYKITSSDLDSNNTLFLSANESKKIELTITSLNDINSKYELYYQTSDNIVVNYKTSTTSLPSGTINGGQSIKVTVIAKNNANSTGTVKFGVAGGFINNNLSLESNQSKILVDNYISTNLVTYLKGLSNSSVVQDDLTTDKNMRYVGLNPNNYVTFNGEKWRIVGVFNSNSHGQSANLVKLVRNNFIGEYSYDYKSNGTYYNTWSTSQLKTMLNSGYYNKTSSYQYYNKSTTPITIDFSTIGLDTQAKDMIQSVSWKAGSISNSRTTLLAVNVYTQERSSTNVSANVGILYFSDFVYATNTTRSTCLNSYLLASNNWQTVWSTSNVGECASTSWLLRLVYDRHPTSNYAWTISPTSGKTEFGYHIFSESTGAVIRDYNPVERLGSIFPAVYLKSSIKCTNCDETSVGSIDNPFELIS